MMNKKAIVAGLAASLLLTACSVVQAPASGVAPASVPAYAGSATTGVDVQALAGVADRVDGTGEFTRRFGARLGVPGLARGAKVTDMWLSKPGEEPSFLLVRYDNGLLVDITAMDSPDSARQLLVDQDDQPGLQGHVRKLAVRGTQGRAVDRLDVPPEFDAEGKAKPGTGVRTGVAKVTWVKGRFVVRVMHADLPADELYPVAEQVDLEP